MMQFISSLRIQDIIDILIVSVFIYNVLLWFKGSRAFQLFKGFLVIVFVFVISKWLGLHTIQWLVEKLAAIILILLIIVFQPELRRALERIGRHSFLSFLLFQQKDQDIGFINKIIKAIEAMSAEKVGALIILEKTTGLSEYLESGVAMDAIVSSELILSIFQKSSPIHDGAVIIQGDRIAAVSCLLPLSESRFMGQKLGARHRAAIGITELSDAVAIVVSEDAGIISMAENATLTRYLKKETLEEKLLTLYKQEQKDFTHKIIDFFSNSKKDNHKIKKTQK